MLSAPQVECSVVHHFGPSLYVREVHMPAGALAIGHYQRFEHLNVFLKGRVLMLKADGSTEELVAPMMFVGKPGRKAGYVLEDVIWQNIYATDETDIEKLEAHFLDKSDAFLHSQIEDLHKKIDARVGDRTDYVSMLDEMGFDETTARAQSVNAKDQCPFPHGAWRVKTGTSSIEGTGLFATAPISSGELIAPARINGLRTPAGRYTNHSKEPNAEMVMLANGDVELKALRDIEGCRGGKDGEEITIDYRQALALSGIKKVEAACQP
ncbi:SET domain-containing protein-lysine N-methyltransferase [Ralstonia insidiosa]|uniref:SET domain-containing protein-lysine N-methyltransferase n=1 Tax=Ralstonia insidiosa TaxID=190721 RepID=UPI001ABFDE2E|nr:SET domain-containing protein-lysine N-methyltransferase [Ralstonia insidiosa]